MNENKMIIYTDGSYCDSEKIGGWVFTNLNGIESFGKVYSTKSCFEMEVTAILEAIKLLDEMEYQKIHIIADSKQVLKVLNKEARASRCKKLFRQLFELVNSKKITITTEWVKGHSGNEGNDRADKLARIGLKK